MGEAQYAAFLDLIKKPDTNYLKGTRSSCTQTPIRERLSTSNMALPTYMLVLTQKEGNYA
jgi:hypothetical protein